MGRLAVKVELRRPAVNYVNVVNDLYPEVKQIIEDFIVGQIYKGGSTLNHSKVGSAHMAVENIQKQSGGQSKTPWGGL